MKNIKILSFLLILMGYLSPLMSQSKVNLNSEYTKFSEDIPSTEHDKIIKNIKTILGKYVYSASFIDAEGEKISDDKYSVFSNIFSPSAMVHDDISYKGKSIPVAKYANKIYDFLGTKGVSYDIGEVYLDEVEVNASGDYLAKINMDKTVYTHLDKNNKYKFNPNGKLFVLDIQVLLHSFDINDVKILSVSSDEKTTYEKKEFYLTGGLNYGGGSLSMKQTTSEYFSNLKPSLSNLGGELMAHYQLKGGKPFYLSAGIGFDIVKINTDLTGNINSLVPEESRIDVIKWENQTLPETTVPARHSGIVVQEGNETIEGANIINIYLGGLYRYKINSKMKLDLGLYFVPSYMTNMEKGSRTISYTGYRFPIDYNFPSNSLLEEKGILEEYKVEEDVEDPEVVKAKSNLSYGLNFSPSLQYEIGFGFGLNVGAHFYYGMTSTLDHENSSDSFTGSETNSILQDYHTGSNRLGASARLGLYYYLGN